MHESDLDSKIGTLFVCYTLRIFQEISGLYFLFTSGSSDNDDNCKSHSDGDEEWTLKPLPMTGFIV